MTPYFNVLCKIKFSTTIPINVCSNNLPKKFNCKKVKNPENG